MWHHSSAFFVALYLVMVITVEVTATRTPPNLIPLRYRKGSLYQSSLERHLTLKRLHGHVGNSTVNYFSQLIDHNNPLRGTFQQRYWVDYTYFDRNQKLCMIYVGGEGPEGGSPEGYAAIVGKNLSALLITLEHRYYGQSLPAPITDKETLKTLHVDTTMADYGSFMDYIETEVIGMKLKWVVVGGSYAGAVSAWLKVTYPTRFTASWSSSGVVNPRFDFTGYDGDIVRVITPECLQSLRNVMGNFSAAWDDSTQRPRLLSLFGTPDYFTKADMAWMLADSTAAAVQYGNKAQLCSAVVPQATDVLLQYAQYVNNTLGAGFGGSCGYSTKCLSDPTMQEQWVGADYCWIFQICNELGYWQVAYPNSLRLSLVNTDYFVNQCRAVFWPTIFSDTFKFNNKYGGAAPNAVHVVATQGSDDPWQTAGVDQSLGADYLEFTAVCDGCGHCGDLGFPSQDDPATITAQRQFVLDNLRKWVNGA